MKINYFRFVLKSVSIVILILLVNFSMAQDSIPRATKSEFWKKVQFGLGGGIGISNGYTNISLSPYAVYRVNDYFSVGPGLQGSYISGPAATQTILGGSIISLFNPIESIQISADLEQVNVNSNIKDSNFTLNNGGNFWTTSLFLGAGYRMGGVIVGARYNVLFDKNKSIYPQAFSPFVRVFF